MDRGTWWAVEEGLRERMRVYKEGHDDDEDDVMLNPAHALVGTHATNKEKANEFADWLGNVDGGQAVIEKFEIGGTRLYTVAPSE